MENQKCSKQIQSNFQVYHIKLDQEPIVFLSGEGDTNAVLLLRVRFVNWFVFVFVILSCLFTAALLSPAGKGLNYWLSFV